MTARRRLGLLLEAARSLPAMLFIELSLRFADLPGTCRRLGLALDLRSSAAPATEPVELPVRARRAGRGALFLLAHWPAGDSCLRRCLLLGHRLRRLDPVLRIGVARTATGDFAAHSWLELDGRTFDTDAGGFATLGSPREASR